MGKLVCGRCGVGLGGQDIFLRLPGTPGGRSYRDLCSMCAQVFCPLPRLLCASASLSFKSAFANALRPEYLPLKLPLSRADTAPRQQQPVLTRNSGFRARRVLARGPPLADA